MRSAANAIYLDHHATTPVDPRVVEAMLPCFTEVFGNPSSRSHRYGEEAARTVLRARRVVRRSIGAILDREIVFTSGATEANNLAIQGVLRAAPAGSHWITSAIEHPSVGRLIGRIEASGASCTVVGVGADGRVDPAAIEAAIRPETVLISVMAVNNEVGTIQPIGEIGAIARRHGAWFHTDASQAAGRIELDVERMGIDLLSLSAHKLYGPPGVGALFVRKTPNKVALAPLLDGGGQEGGLRSGTENVPGIVGFARAVELAAECRAHEEARLARLRDRLLATLRSEGLDPVVHGSMRHRVGGNLNLSFPGLPADAVQHAAPRLAMSAGSACSATHPDVSHTLTAMGVPHDLARGAVRIGLGRTTSASDIAIAGQTLASAVWGLRAKLGGQRAWTRYSGSESSMLP